MSQPESTERCPVCQRAFARCGSREGCYRLGFERVSRALAEAETLKRISDSQAHEAWIERDGALARLAEAEKRALRVFDAHEREMNVYLDRLLAAEERAAQAERALKLIAAPKYGLQGLVEDDAPESDFTGYWKGLAQEYEAQARTGLQEAAKGRAPEAPPDPNDLAGITDVISGGAQGEEK